MKFRLALLGENVRTRFRVSPPPPPPPQRNHDAAGQVIRGRGYGGGVPPGRGAPRGSGFQRGHQTGGRGRGNRDTYRGAMTFSANQASPSRGSGSNQSFKRTHAAAFSPSLRSRPYAPPAIPSFNASIENLLYSKPAPKASETLAASSRKTNFLGLTPADAEVSGSEDDIDEESRSLAGPSSHDLHFEYKGHTSTLRTPADIAGWIAERRKRWPTEAKREAARKEAEGKKRRWEEEKKKRAEASKAAKKSREAEPSRVTLPKHDRTSQAQSSSDQGAGSDSVRAAQSRAENLRRKALKAQQKLEAAERELLKVGNKSQPADAEGAHAEFDDDSSSILSDSSDLTESTSSSGSDSESEPGPEETSSKIQVARIENSSRDGPINKRLCQFFTKHGTCKYGAKCRYTHDINQAPFRNPKPMANASKPGRKGLWQVMVEQEEEGERKRLLEAIIALGKQGVLDDP